MTLQQVRTSQEPDTPWHLHSTFMWARSAWGAEGVCQTDLGHDVGRLPRACEPQAASIPSQPSHMGPDWGALGRGVQLEGSINQRDGKGRGERRMQGKARQQDTDLLCELVAAPNCYSG